MTLTQAQVWFRSHQNVRTARPGPGLWLIHTQTLQSPQGHQRPGAPGQRPGGPVPVGPGAPGGVGTGLGSVGLPELHVKRLYSLRERKKERRRQRAKSFGSGVELARTSQLWAGVIVTSSVRKAGVSYRERTLASAFHKKTDVIRSLHSGTEYCKRRQLDGCWEAVDLIAETLKGNFTDLQSAL